MDIGKRIKNRRNELKMTQEELAEKCGYKSRSSINKIELSKQMPDNNIKMIADVLGVTPSYLMGWDSNDDDLTCIYSIYSSLNEEDKASFMRIIKELGGVYNAKKMLDIHKSVDE